jgi:P-type Mg2+ transporter
VSVGWRQHSLRVRLSAWYAGAGVVVLVTCVMAALMGRIWVPATRADVLIVLFVGLPGAACAFAAVGYLIAGRALAPLKVMAERARRLSARSLSERLPIVNPADELGQLAGVFNEMLARLEDSFVELKRFTADASHELRTPLTAIRAVGEVGMRQSDAQGLRETVGSMLEEAARLNQLIDRLLLLAQADDDTAPVHLTAAPVRTVVSQVTDLLGVVAEEKGQRLEIEEVQDVTAVMDSGLLRLALMNLVQNAIRYSPAATPIRLRACASGADAVIEVIDQGPGISQRHQPKVFERFYRVDRGRSQSEGGAGLGLAIVKWATERMSGSVELESETGRGSIFRVRLPLAGIPAADHERVAEASSGLNDGDETGVGRAAATTPGAEIPEAVERGNAPLPDSLIDLRECLRTAVSDVFARLRTAPIGLTWGEARRRLQHFGPNEAVTHRVPGWPTLVWHAANTPFNGVLALLGTVSLITQDFEAAVVMAAMVILSTVLRFRQEWKSLVQAESLRRLVRNKVTVRRADNDAVSAREPSSLDYSASEIVLEELVPGDIVLLSAGDMIPADLLLLESRDLFVTQSALTGEAMPVEKAAGALRTSRALAAESSSPESALLDQANLLFMGSSVISGTGRAVAVATGQRTYFGGMASSLADRRAHTAFERGVNQVSWLLIRFMLAMVPIVFFINGLLKGRWVEAFFFAIAVAVGLTPEMLPMIVNANLARGALALSRRKTIVKQLNAIQNLGAMDILCTDKTGTLTQDHVVLMQHVDLHGQSSRRVLEHAYLNSFFQTGLKNLLDRAVVDRGNEHGLRALQSSFRKVDEIPFDFTRRRMSVVLQDAGGNSLLYCKGAVEEMLQICSKVEQEGRAVPLSGDLRERLKDLRDELNDDGMRVVAVGYKVIDPAPKPFSVEDETNLIFSGFVTFLDPPKENVSEALRLLRQHGVSVKILTGDNAVIACRICREVGLDARQVVTGGEIDHLPDDALGDLAERTTVFAKLSPTQKSRIVRALKLRSHTVGFMGDGINDATALREADVGISVDSGVDIAREAADIILLEKSLLVLERGVVEGRHTFGNIVKYIKMTASSNFGNVLSLLIASAVLPFLPMLAIQLLVQNLLYDMSQTTIPWDRMDEEFLRAPRQWEAGSIATFMLWIGPISSLFDIATFVILWYGFGADSSLRQSLFQSGWFIEGLLTQVLVVHIIRTEKMPFIQSRATWPVVSSAVLIMACGIWLPFSPLASALKLQPLPLAYLPWVALILVAYCVLTQLVKRFYIRRFGKWL